jgi:hyperosmotically inducible periplasmic protein
MKLMQVAKATAVTVALTLNLGAQAQGSAASADNTTAAAPVSPKLGKAANRALVKKVRHALARTKDLDPTHIYVKAVDGVVTLTGNCVSQQQIDLANASAQKVDGVLSVSNKLSVKTPQ